MTSVVKVPCASQGEGGFLCALSTTGCLVSCFKLGRLSAAVEGAALCWALVVTLAYAGPRAMIDWYETRRYTRYTSKS